MNEKVNEMEYVYAAMLLHSAGKDIDDKAVGSVLKAAGVEADGARVKALVASLGSVDIDEAMATAVANSNASPRIILDLASGAGEPALTLARRFPGTEVVASDRDEGVLSIARRRIASEFADPPGRVTAHQIDLASLSTLAGDGGFKGACTSAKSKDACQGRRNAVNKNFCMWKPSDVSKSVTNEEPAGKCKCAFGSAGKDCKESALFAGNGGYQKDCHSADSKSVCRGRRNLGGIRGG